MRNESLSAVDELDRAFKVGDLESVLNFCQSDAIVVIEPARAAQGSHALRTPLLRRSG